MEDTNCFILYTVLSGHLSTVDLNSPTLLQTIVLI